MNFFSTQCSNFNRHFRGLKGLTLMEVLAVVVLMTLTAGTMLMLVGSSDDAARTMRAMAAIQNVDSQARLLARTSGHSTYLQFNAEENSLRLNQFEDDDPVIWVDLERPCSFLSVDGQRLDSIVYDRAGASADFKIVVEATGSKILLNVAGLTGWISKERAQ